MTARRRRREPEVERTLAAARRMVRAAGRAADTPDLEALAALSREVDEAMRAAVTRLREVHGYTWADVGSALGITRQSAQERFGKRRGETT